MRGDHNKGVKETKGLNTQEVIREMELTRTQVNKI